MDPLSMVTGIGSLCGLAVKLIFVVSEFIDQVQQAPKELQALNTELASLYAGLGHIKMALQAPRISQIPPAWKADFDSLADDCDKTLKEVDILINKAKRTETTGSARRMLKTVSFVFKANQVEFLRRRIVSQNGILQILLAALTESRGGHIEQRLEDIHTKVEELLSSRQNIKEVLVVLEKEDDVQQADYVLSDRTSQHAAPQSSEMVERQDLLAQIRQNARERATQARTRGDTNDGPADGEDDTRNAQAGSSSSPPVPDWMSTAMNWMNSPSGREAVARAWAQASQGIGQQMMAANSSDIAERVFEVTRPSADVLRAIEIIDSRRVWPLTRLRRRSPEMKEWREITPRSLGFKKLGIYFTLEESKTVYLHHHLIQVENGPQYDHSCEPGACGILLGGKGVLEGRTFRDVFDPNCIPEGVETYCHEYTFYNDQDAKEFHFCVTQIGSHVQRARKIKTIVFKNVRGCEGQVYDSVAFEKEACSSAELGTGSCVVT